MARKSILDLVIGALPVDFNPALLIDSDLSECGCKESVALMDSALRSCPYISWKAYLEAYPDIKQEGVDPVVHFLTDGVFEGRRLYTRKYLPGTNGETQPKVSVVVPNFNNATFLERSLDSLIFQSLKEIEIIIVDDASTDDSLSIIKRFASRDPRIKIIAFAANQSQHMARKAGVEAASGQYIMFLDPDDFYAETACEIAYNAIDGQYDFVCFNSHLIFPSEATRHHREYFNNYINRGKPGKFEAWEILPAIYENYSLSDILWNKIYRADMCKQAFSEMQNGWLPRGQDIYETLVITSKASCAAKIDAVLYFYRTGAGVSTPTRDRSSQKAFAATGECVAGIESYLKKIGKTSYIEQIIPNYLNRSVYAWLHYSTKETVTDYFNDMARQYGIIKLLDFIARKHPQAWELVADRFQYYRPNGKTAESAPRRIGILYSVMTSGGAERVCWDLADLLNARGYAVTIFLEGSNDNDFRFKEPIKVVYLGGHGSDWN
ncbi:MAG: glycosyltransferase, partial [Clostridia bacterium]|nr:glycosyltransferase [Clostridia bacterium]